MNRQHYTNMFNLPQVNLNGHLTFDRPWESFIPQEFPLYGLIDIIALFWTDLDNRYRGQVLYNQYTSGTVLKQATNDINQYFSHHKFVASWVFVATWSEVAYYPNLGMVSLLSQKFKRDKQYLLLTMYYFPGHNRTSGVNQ